MNYVIDSNVVTAICSLEAGIELPCTASPDSISLSTNEPVFVDAGLKIETDWRQTCDNEFFDAWLSRGYQEDWIQILPDKLPKPNGIDRRLINVGFPWRGSRDKWYILLSIAIAKKKLEVTLISEDLDFFEPREKGVAQPARRSQILSGKRSSVQIICEAEGVAIRSVESHK